MSRFSELLERFQAGEETGPELQELSQLLREDPSRGLALYDAMMLEADLFESYAGIAQVRTSSKAAPRGIHPRMALAWALAAFLLIGLAILLFTGRTTSEKPQENLPTAPRPPEPKPVEPPAVPELKKPVPERIPGREHEEREHASRVEEAEREYQKGLREVERKRLQGKTKEADEKLREIERERDKKIREREREHDRERRKDDR